MPRLLKEAQLLLQLNACLWPVREHCQLRLDLLDVLADGSRQLIVVLMQLAAEWGAAAVVERRCYG
jgi:hypothetical protein